MITFKEYLKIIEADVKGAVHYKPGAIIPSAVKTGAEVMNPFKVVNPARPHKYEPVFRANAKKGRLKQKPTAIMNKKR